MPMEQSKINNPEKSVACGTQYEGKQNKTTTQYVLETTNLYGSTHNNVNKAWALLQTN